MSYLYCYCKTSLPTTNMRKLSAVLLIAFVDITQIFTVHVITLMFQSLLVSIMSSLNKISPWYKITLSRSYLFIIVFTLKTTSHVFCFKIQSICILTLEDRWIWNIWIHNAWKSSTSRFIGVLRTEYDLDTFTIGKFLYFWAVADVGSLAWDANPFVLSAPPSEPQVRSVWVW